jgi:phosphopantothenoylcysteine decarboxylase/phosphopantothenate--cysteine ligase
MKCVVTAGPTYEELDEVRRLTNFSTGKLGIGLANYLTECGHEVILLLGQAATHRGTIRVWDKIAFTTTADLRARLRALAGESVRAVFHAAAVSDFTFGRIWRRQEDGRLIEVHAGKISTRYGCLLAELKPTPKVIHTLRGWFPRACLIGWKYDVEGDRASVVAEAKRQLTRNRTQACVVNGRAYGEGFGLVTPTGNCQHLADVRELYARLEHLVAGRHPKTGPERTG